MKTATKIPANYNELAHLIITLREAGFPVLAYKGQYDSDEVISAIGKEDDEFIYAVLDAEEGFLFYAHADGLEREGIPMRSQWVRLSLYGEPGSMIADWSITPQTDAIFEVHSELWVSATPSIYDGAELLAALQKCRLALSWRYPVDSSGYQEAMEAAITATDNATK